MKGGNYAKESTSQTIESDNAYTYLKPTSAIPGPKGVPLLGTLFDYVGPLKKKGFEFKKIYKVTVKTLQLNLPIKFVFAYKCLFI